jgi:hypothetical protein
MNSLKNILEKSILDDIENTIQYGDDASRIMDYINFLVDSSEDNYKDNVNDIVAFCIKNNLITCKKNGELVCDRSKLPTSVDLNEKITFALAYSLLFNASSYTNFNTKILPKSLKKLTFLNCSIVHIGILGNNNLPIDITAEGATIDITALESNNTIKLGKIICDKLIIGDHHLNNVYPVGVSFKPGTTITKRLELTECSELYEIVGKKLNIKNIELHQNFARNLLRKTGVLNEDTKVWIANK